MEHSIVFLDAEEDDQSLVRARFPHAVFIPGLPEGDDLVRACAGAAVVSTFITTNFTRSVIEHLPNLKLLCTRSVGFDHIDLDACKEKGIVVCNVPDYGSHVIAEHVFALLLSAIRHVREGDERVEGGTFDYHGLRGMALKGKTIGILGTGKIGRKVAKIAYGYEMKILATDICRTIDLERAFNLRYVEMDELLAESDILTLHVPASSDNEHMLNDQAFALMKDGVVLINTARGSLIDSAALLRALESGKVSHALLDVLEHERNFAENASLIKHPHVITTPHIAFYADDSMKNMYLDCFASIEQWINGTTPEHVIHPLTIVSNVASAKSA